MLVFRASACDRSLQCIAGGISSRHICACACACRWRILARLVDAWDALAWDGWVEFGILWHLQKAS